MPQSEERTPVFLHIILEVKDAPSEEWLTRKALEKGVKVYPASVSYVTPPETHAVLLGFGGLSEKSIADGIKKLKTAWLNGGQFRE